MQFVHLNIKLFVVLFYKHIALIKIFSTPWLGLRSLSPPPFLATSSRCSLSLPAQHSLPYTTNCSFNKSKTQQHRVEVM